MILAQIENGICISIYTADTLKENTVEIDSLNSDYLFRRFENETWGDKIEVTVKEENDLTTEQEQTVLKALAETLSLLEEAKIQLAQQEQVDLDRDELYLESLMLLEEIKLNQELGGLTK